MVPLAGGLPERLAAGIDSPTSAAAADTRSTCSRGSSRPVASSGTTVSDDALAHARAEAEEWGLDNARFEVLDVAILDRPETFDLVTVFDAIHDQAHPATVLANAARCLRSGGTFLMVDINASSPTRRAVRR